MEEGAPLPGDDSRIRPQRPRRASPEPPSDERSLFERAVEELSRRDARTLQRYKHGGRMPSERPLAGPAARGSGETAYSRRLDLHGRDPEAAESLVDRLLAAAPSGDWVLVVHGRGSGRLARRVVDQLDRDPRVAEHRGAPPRLGGEGARLVRVR
ncbi:MAG: hypothetical protein DWQ36_17310 [Acidobacteria bacterium]|nr:MAG: hypothetical protein DWQ30_05405 [Acidobacteriota bacterium]REK04605.1 MAG: hypothetical protein DWQ36_17310 [Acidobacteriota bacterium]